MKIIIALIALATFGYVMSQPRAAEPCVDVAACAAANLAAAKATAAAAQLEQLRSIEALRHKTAQTAVLALLRDPESAIFGDIFTARDGKAACGSVNARNGFGGMTGRRAFVVTVAGVQLQDEGTKFTKLWNTKCAGVRYSGN